MHTSDDKPKKNTDYIEPTENADYIEPTAVQVAGSTVGNVPSGYDDQLVQNPSTDEQTPVRNAPGTDQAIFADAKKYFQENATMKICKYDSGQAVLNVGGKLFLINEHKPLGQGAFGVVYRTVDEQGKVFALKKEKTFSADEQKNKQVREAKEREIKIMEKLGKHQAHAEIIDGKDNCFVTVFSLEKGITLDRYIQGKVWTGFSLKEKYQHALKAAFDLCFLHQAGIIHADIKSDNIMFVNEGVQTPEYQGSQVAGTFVDFGLSLPVEKGSSETKASQQAYMLYSAPEIVKDQQYSFKSDIYALGVMFLGHSEAAEKALREKQHSRDPEKMGALNDQISRIGSKVRADSLLLDNNLFGDMLDADPSKRPDVITVIGRLVQELKKQPDFQHDDYAIQMVHTYETYLKTKGKLTGETFKEQEARHILEEFKAMTDVPSPIKVMAEGYKTVDQKMVFIKGYCAFKSQTDKALVGDPLIKHIDQVSGKARFLGAAGCKSLYEEYLVKGLKAPYKHAQQQSEKVAQTKPAAGA